MKEVIRAWLSLEVMTKVFPLLNGLQEGINHLSLSKQLTIYFHICG